MEKRNIYRLIESFSVNTPVFKTPEFRQDKNVIDRIARSYELYNDATVSKCVNLILKSILKVIQTIDSPGFREVVEDKRFIDGLSSLLLDLLISSNCYGLLDWTTNGKVRIPNITPISPAKVRKLGPLSSPRIALLYEYPRELVSLLQRAFGKGDKDALKALEEYGDFSFIERQASLEDVKAILDPSLLQEAKRNLNKLFLIKKDRLISYSIYKTERYGEPFIYKAFPYVEVKNQIMTADASFYRAASMILFLLTTGREDEKISSINKRLKVYLENLNAIDRVGIMTAESTTKVQVVSGWDLSRREAEGQLERYEKLIVSSIFEVSEDAKPEELVYAINSHISIVEPLIRDVFKLVAEKNGLDFKDFYLAKVSVSLKDVSTLIQLRDRGELTRSTLLKSLGFDVEREAEIRKKEKEKGYDDLMLPGFVPFQGRGRPKDEED